MCWRCFWLKWFWKTGRGGWTHHLRVKDEGAFEEVRGEGKTQTTQQRGSDGPKLTLGNKFDALRDE